MAEIQNNKNGIDYTPIMEYERKGKRLIAYIMGFGMGALSAYVFTSEPHIHVRAEGISRNNFQTNNIEKMLAPTGVKVQLETGKNIPVIDMTNNNGYGIVGVEFNRKKGAYDVVGAKYDAKSTNAIGTNEFRVIGQEVSTNKANTNNYHTNNVGTWDIAPPTGLKVRLSN